MRISMLIIGLLIVHPVGRAQFFDEHFDTTLTVSGQVFSVAGLAIARLVGSNASQIDDATWVDTTACFPCVSQALLVRYRPEFAKAEYYSIDEAEHISAVAVHNDRIWVAFSFYNGEGVTGLGGIGYYELADGAVGLLRHPGLLDVSIAELLVNDDTIYAKTFGSGELGVGTGHGLVAISRATLQAIARVPAGGDVVWDKDGEWQHNTSYRAPIGSLVHQRDLIPIELPPWSKERRRAIEEIGPDGFMKQTLQSDLATCMPKPEY
jgi:hypothetical protein